MSRSNLYSTFSRDIEWITEKILADHNSLPNELMLSSDYFLKERLVILTDEKNKDKTKNFDPEVGRPVPYIVMWLADAFNYTEKSTREIALGLVYSAIATTIKDDYYDEMNPSKILLRLYDHYYLKYLSSFSMINEDSHFWYVLSYCIKQHKEYDEWYLNYKHKPGSVALSDDFLSRASQYFNAVVLPSMAAIAFLSGNEDKIDNIKRFLSNFSKAWRIYDDLVDWKKDINKENYNLNTVLLSAHKKNYSRLTKDDLYLNILEEDFICEIYDKMVNYLQESQRSIKEINGKYLDKFILGQINFHKTRKRILLERSKQFKEDFIKNIENVLAKTDP